jgi:capsule polysaccharide export protein KpsE/RkpR
MNNYFNNMDLIKMISRWKLHLLIVTAAGLLLSVFFSGPMFIKPKYKSFAVIYPSNLIPYGVETPTEQMLQLFQANDIRDAMMKRFNLVQHYGVDTTAPSYRYFLDKEFDDNVKVLKTEFEAVKIEVFDTDPLTARDMAVQMLSLFDIKTRALHVAKSQEVVQIHKEELRKKQVEIDSLGTLMKELKIRYGLLDYKSQAKEASREYYRSLGGNSQKTSDMVVSIRNLEEKGHEFNKLDALLDGALKSYKLIKVDYDAAVRDVDKKLSYTSVVIRPEIPDKKASPVRWLIVLFASITSFIFALFVISLFEQYRKR